MSMDDLARECHATARLKGFYDHNPRPSEKLLLIVTEVAEVVEALRDENRDAEAEEVADIVIRVLDYAAWRGISLDREVALKMERNGSRPRLHGRVF